MIDIVLPILSLLFFVAFDLFLIAARSGYLQTSTARLLAWRDQMESKVTQTVTLLSALPRLRASMNVMLVLTRFGIAGLVVLFIYLRLNQASFWIYLIGLLIVAILLFWLEWIVEQTVFRNPERWALRLVSLARILMAVSAVFLIPLFVSKEGQEIIEPSSMVTQDEVKTLVDAGQEEGIFEQDERRMIYSIFQLGETLAREIMVPRIDMLALDVQTPMQVAVDSLLQSGYSRVPVFEESVDNMLGLLYAKDLLRVWREGGQDEIVKDLLRPAYFVPEAKKVDELLTEMQSQRIHIAIVVDEYGGVAGLVTLEDIIEEILGEIQDEYDEGEEAPYQKLSDEQYLFLGRIDLDDFNEIMNSELPDDEADTLGGYIYSRLGRVPAVGDKVRKENLVLTVEQVSARRIRKVRAFWQPSDVQSGVEREHG